MVSTLSSSSYGALSGDPVSNRTVLLERRFPGASSWTTVASMTPQGSAGTYEATVSLTGSYEWRARFPRPPGEGILGSTSATVSVTFLGCGTCPAAASTRAGAPAAVPIDTGCAR